MHQSIIKTHFFNSKLDESPDPTLQYDNLIISRLTFVGIIFSRALNPRATSKQYPMLGTYRTLSATTKPTGKNRFEAGKNGTARRAKLINKALLLLNAA